MPHAHVGSGPDELARGANLLGAVSLAVSDRVRAAAERGAGQGGSAPAALVSLAGYLDGSPIDSLRGPLGLTHSAAVRVVDRLVEAGLARRREGPDRRSVAVELTPEGRAAARAAGRARARPPVQQPPRRLRTRPLPVAPRRRPGGAAPGRPARVAFDPMPNVF